MKKLTDSESIPLTQTLAKLLSCLFALGAIGSAADAATITGTGTGDTVAVDGFVTLREALTSANQNADINADVVGVGAYGSDTINLNIAGNGVHIIAPTAALPTINDPVTVDGYTQPGSAANTQASADDAVLLIELNGANAGDANGLTITAGHSGIRGLVINRFIGPSGSGGNAISLSEGPGNVVEGNFLGISASGLVALANEDNGINLAGGSKRPG